MKHLVLATWLLLPISAAIAGDPPPGPTEDDARKTIAALKQALEKGDDDAKKSAIDACPACPHALVAAALAPVLASGPAELRISAARALGKMKSVPDAAKALHAGLKPNEKSEDVLTAVFKAMVAIGDLSSVGVCRKWIEDRMDLTDSEEVPGVGFAITALGFLKHKASVDTLIELTKKKKVSGIAGGTGSGGAKWKCAIQIEASLRRLTGEKLETIDAWDDWWKKHAKDFEEDLTIKK